MALSKKRVAAMTVASATRISALIRITPRLPPAHSSRHLDQPRELAPVFEFERDLHGDGTPANPLSLRRRAEGRGWPAILPVAAIVHETQPECRARRRAAPFDRLRLKRGVEHQPVFAQQLAVLECDSARAAGSSVPKPSGFIQPPRVSAPVRRRCAPEPAPAGSRCPAARAPGAAPAGRSPARGCASCTARPAGARSSACSRSRLSSACWMAP